MQINKCNSVPTPDEIFDEALKDTSPSAFKCLAVIVNKTIRYNKLWDFISLSQFEEATNLTRPTVIRSLRELSEKYITILPYCYKCKTISDVIKIPCQFCNQHSMILNLIAINLTKKYLAYQKSIFKKTTANLLNADTHPEGSSINILLPDKISLLPGSKSSKKILPTVNHTKETIYKPPYVRKRKSEEERLSYSLNSSGDYADQKAYCERVIGLWDDIRDKMEWKLLSSFKRFYQHTQREIVKEWYALYSFDTVETVIREETESFVIRNIGDTISSLAYFNAPLERKAKRSKPKRYVIPDGMRLIT